MRKPKHPNDPPEPPPPEGGRALERLRQFEHQRGLPPRKQQTKSTPPAPAAPRKKRGTT